MNISKYKYYVLITYFRSEQSWSDIFLFTLKQGLL